MSNIELLFTKQGRKKRMNGGCDSCGGSCWMNAEPMHILQYLSEHGKQGNISGGEMARFIIENLQDDMMTGGSFWSDVVGVIGDALPFIAPMLNVIPIVGPLLSTGAAALGSAARVGAEAWKRAEDIKSGDPIKVIGAFSKPSVAGIAKDAIQRAGRVGEAALDYITRDGKIVAIPRQPISRQSIPTLKPPQPPLNKYKQQIMKYAPPLATGKGSMKGTKYMRDKMAHLRSMRGGNVKEFLKKHKGKIAGTIGAVGTLAGLAGLATRGINARDPDLMRRAYNPNVFRPFDLRGSGSMKGTKYMKDKMAYLRSLKNVKGRGMKEYLQKHKTTIKRGLKTAAAAAAIAPMFYQGYQMTKDNRRPSQKYNVKFEDDDGEMSV